MTDKIQEVIDKTKDVQAKNQQKFFLDFYMNEGNNIGFGNLGIDFFIKCIERYINDDTKKKRDTARKFYSSVKTLFEELYDQYQVLSVFDRRSFEKELDLKCEDIFSTLEEGKVNAISSDELTRLSNYLLLKINLFREENDIDTSINNFDVISTLTIGYFLCNLPMKNKKLVYLKEKDVSTNDKAIYIENYRIGISDDLNYALEFYSKLRKIIQTDSVYFFVSKDGKQIINSNKYSKNYYLEKSIKEFNNEINPSSIRQRLAIDSCVSKSLDSTGLFKCFGISNKKVAELHDQYNQDLNSGTISYSIEEIIRN